MQASDAAAVKEVQVIQRNFLINCRNLMKTSSFVTIFSILIFLICIYDPQFVFIYFKNLVLKVHD